MRRPPHLAYALQTVKPFNADADDQRILRFVDGLPTRVWLVKLGGLAYSD